MPLRDRLTAALIAAIWGVNFLAIHASLEHFPPYLNIALRWAVLAVPALLFVPRPPVSWRLLIAYGLGFGMGQFVFLYWGMTAGMPTGLASLVLQASGPFTVILGALLLGERVGWHAQVGVLVAVAGLVIVGSQRLGGGLLPFVLTLLGALSLAFGHVAARAARAPNPLHLTLWVAVIPPVPMLLVSLAVEGPERDLEALRTAGSAPAALLGLLYTVVISAVLASTMWNSLLARHPTSVVAPWQMLVPVVGMTVAALVLGERPTWVEVLGAAVVVAGVLYGSRTRGTPPVVVDPVPPPT